MRILGQNASLDAFRLDLVYLGASLSAEEQNPALNTLAAEPNALLTELRQHRSELEQTEEFLIFNIALRKRRDHRTDKRVSAIGGTARAAFPADYSVLFPTLSPSKVNRLALDEQLTENERIFAELSARPVNHPLRLAYEADFKNDIQALKQADTNTDAAELALTLARSKVRQFKIKADSSRVKIHGEILAITGDKKEADSFFRETSDVPSRESSPEEDAPEVNAPPANSPNG